MNSSRLTNTIRTPSGVNFVQRRISVCTWLRVNPVSSIAVRTLSSFTASP